MSSLALLRRNVACRSRRHRVREADADVGVAVQPPQRMHAIAEAPLIERLIEPVRELHLPRPLGRDMRRGKREQRVAERQRAGRRVRTLLRGKAEGGKQKTENRETSNHSVHLGGSNRAPV